MNNRIMPKWSEVKDCNGINLHLFDAVQVITSGNKRNNQTGRIMALLKTKPYLQMVEVLFQDEKRSNFLTSSLRLVESSEEEKGKSLAKIDSLKLMGAEITDSDFCVDRYNNDAFLFDDETQTWNVMLEGISDVDRLFGTFFETEQNDSYCNIYADVDEYCTKLANHPSYLREDGLQEAPEGVGCGRAEICEQHHAGRRRWLLRVQIRCRYH